MGIMDKYKELIKLLRECSTGRQCQKCRREKDPLCMVNFMTEAADVIEELLKASEKPTGWIPVSERPPEKNGHYLVTVKSRADYSKKRFVAIEVKHSRGWMSDDNIIAWKPSPEPYKEE